MFLQLQRTARGFCLLFLLVIVPVGCAVQRGTVHEVRRGQTLWRISRVYDVELNALIRVNDIRDVRRVRPGTRLIIPGKRRPREVPRRVPETPPSSSPRPDRAPDSSPDAAEADDKSPPRPSGTSPTDPPSGEPGANGNHPGFEPRWPCRGKIVSGFRANGGPAHRGVLIRAEPGENVRAAEEGNVKLAGEWDRLPELGKIVIIFHTNDLTTVYAHLNSIRVSEGERVGQGDVLGTAGRTGDVENPVCYFEIRYRLKPRDPLIFLGEAA